MFKGQCQSKGSPSGQNWNNLNNKIKNDGIEL